MHYYQPPPNPLTLGLDGAALAAALWAPLVLLAAAPIAYLAVRFTAAAASWARNRFWCRRAAAGITAPIPALVVAGGWLLLATALNAPLAAADTPGAALDAGLQRDAIAVNHAVAEHFPQIRDIAGVRPDHFGVHEQGRALDILIPGDPTSPQSVALGDDIRDFLLRHAEELGVQHVIWRQHLYRADGTSEPMQDRDGDVANHLTHLHVTTVGGGHP